MRNSAKDQLRLIRKEMKVQKSAGISDYSQENEIDDLYSIATLELFTEEDIISPLEEGFMHGYLANQEGLQWE